MKTKVLITIAIVSSFVIRHSSFAQGSLTPPGAPAPTMKTLDQVEARTPISSVPFSIITSGSYYLTKNLNVTSTYAIFIDASGVTLDLNGFTLSSTEVSATGTGILIGDGLRNLTIKNGFIQGGVTNNGSGIYSGSGFSFGIYYFGFPPFNVRVSGVSISGCKTYGILLGSGTSAVVESCTVQTVGSYGIYASAVSHSSAADCGTTGISADTASDCYGQSPGGNGIFASTATGCYGVSSNGVGVYAVTANNCYGSSSSSQGINAETASNCRGVSVSNRGVFVNVAIACSGHTSGGSYGLYATSIANTCYGYSQTGMGLNAFIAIGCMGSYPIGYTYHYNMPP
jgi:hypothetical protein